MNAYVGNVDPADVTHPNSVWGLAPRCQQVTVLHEISEGLLHVPPAPFPLPLYMTPRGFVGVRGAMCPRAL